MCNGDTSLSVGVGGLSNIQDCAHWARAADGSLVWRGDGLHASWGGDDYGRVDLTVSARVAPKSQYETSDSTS